MTTPPAQMIDRWHNRAEPGPDESTIYWHMLMNDQPQVIDLARDAQQRLARFPGLHMTPLERLHMTTLVAGPAEHFSPDQLRQMITAASAMLADTPAVTVTVGGIVYHPEAIMLDVKPKRALAHVHDAVRAATMTETARHGWNSASLDSPHHHLLQHRGAGHGTHRRGSRAAARTMPDPDQHGQPGHPERSRTTLGLAHSRNHPPRRACPDTGLTSRVAVKPTAPAAENNPARRTSADGGQA